MKLKIDYNYYVYIVASISGVLYIGMTNNLIKRIQQHKLKICDGFTKHYNVDKLVYYEHYEYVWNAIHREKELKGWLRKKKVELIEKDNPNWRDLFDDLSK